MVHKITISQTAKVGKAPDALARVPEMMDTPPILWFDERKGVASGYALFIWRASCGIATNPYNLGSCTSVESDLCGPGCFFRAAEHRRLDGGLEWAAAIFQKIK